MIHKIKDTGTDIEKRNLVGTNTDEELGSIGVNLGRVATSKYNANAIAACIVYLVCSVCMVLINKVSIPTLIFSISLVSILAVCLIPWFSVLLDHFKCWS